MKFNKKLLWTAVLVAPLLVLGTASAVEDPNNTDQTTTQQQTETQNKKKTGNEGLTLQQRLDKYKAEAKTRLDNAQKTRIQTRCKASQGVVSNVKGRINGIETSRGRVYTNLTNRLTSLDEKLKAKGLDTATYEAQLTELQTMIDTFNTDLAKYKEAVSDLSEMNCTADPEAFKASLETARSLRAQVVKDGQAIKTYLSGTIKPTLQALRQQLETSNNQGGQ